VVDGFTRIDGWKAIAAHFRRDRSTVIRWAASGDFPVHRVAGRRSGSVWAYAHELDAWLARTGVDMVADRPPEFGTEVALPTTGTDPAPPTARRKVGRNTLNVACGALLLAGAFAMLLARVSSAPPVHNRTLPGDATTADLYLQARDDLSTRTPASLRKASAEFAAVISRDPGFAPAYAGLADTYVLAPEFIGTPSDVALAKAEAATKAALAIDPDSADANRALGFIDYWWRGDIRTARDHFGRSLRSDPNSAQTHFWYGNILIDVGEAEDGLRELRAARLLDPGSWAIQADYAFALWCRGPGDPGLRDLEDLTAEDPKLGSAHRYLSLIFLAKGDIRAYLDESQGLAALEGDK
jgi:tetratricopeptide (TPR) repeat protein